MTTPTLAEARALLAAALTAVEGVTEVTATGFRSQLRAGYGWTRVAAVRPASFRTSVVDLEAIVVLGQDELTAEAQLDALAVPLLDAATNILELPAAGVTVEPVVMSTGPTSSLFVLVVSLSTEVS